MNVLWALSRFLAVYQTQTDQDELASPPQLQILADHFNLMRMVIVFVDKGAPDQA